MTSQDAEVADILEDLELQKWILENHSPADIENIEETKNTIKDLERKVRRLCGEPSPPLEVPEPSIPLQSAPQSVSQSPYHTPRPAIGNATMSPSSHRPQTYTLPPPHGMLSPTPGHWPSSAPSPFGGPPPASTNGRHDWTFAGLPSRPAVAEPSRKRDRQDSTGLSSQTQPSKKAATSSGPSAMDTIKQRHEVELERNRKIHADMRDFFEVRRVAELERRSEEEVLEEIDTEEQDAKRAIELKYQMEIDEEFARSLQAAENGVEVYSPSPPQQPSYNVPSQSYNVPSHSPFRPTPTFQSLQPIRPAYGAFGNGQSSSVHDSEDDFDSDGIEEISADYWNSRFGDPIMPGRFPSRPLPPPMPLPSQYTPGGPYSSYAGFPPIKSEYPTMYPGSMAGAASMHRSLPWMYDPPQKKHSEMKVFDLVREQQDMDEDAIDFEMYKEEDFPDDIKTLVTGIKDINKATKADNDDSPAALQVTLMKHQKIGLAWLKAKEESHQKGGILADDMGLGKTIQTIALMVARPPTDPDRHPCLIVAPKALMDQWRLEIGRHVKKDHFKLKVLIFHGTTNKLGWNEISKYDVVITTFGTLTANYKITLQADEFEKQGRDVGIVRATRAKATLFTKKSLWHRVIVDEAQNIKNPAAKSNKACCALNSTYRWCLTGTPMMNRLEDFQALLSFLRIRPYNNMDKFKKTFTKPIKSGFGEESIMTQLRVLVKSVCLRRTKKTKIDGQPILQLPPKVIEKVHVVFNENEKEIYEELNSNTQRQVTRLLNSGTFGRNYSHILVLLLRLRQACDHPFLITGGNLEQTAPGVEGVDLMANAKLLPGPVVERLKNIFMTPESEKEEDGSCPVCFDVVENSVVYIPCGHGVCSECFAKITDPAQLARESDSDFAKCQNCRGPVDPKKITDANSFKKVYVQSTDAEDDKEDAEGSGSDRKTGSDSTTETAASTDSGSETASDEDDSETDTESSDSNKKRKPKKKSFAQLRAAAQKNKGEKKKYLRRLEKTWQSSAKIDKTMEILQANEDRGEGEKTIIFSQFTSLLDLLEVPLTRRGWGYMRFDGSMNLNERNAAVACFTDNPDCRIMIVSLKAGNAGLNLVAASHVVIFDPFWNPYVEDQAIDRAHRIGQTRDVFVHRLLIEGTVEDRIIELQDKKRELISGALDEGGSMNVSRLDATQLAFLFGVGA